MKILFLSRNFNRIGYRVLESLIENNFEIGGIVRKKGLNILDIPILRKISITFYKLLCKYHNSEAIKFLDSDYLYAKKNNIKIITTTDINSKSFYNELKKVNPDLILVGGGWHQKINENIFNFPKYGTINIHPSLLPEYRGTSIHRWQILNGEKRSGITIHYVNNNFDEGGIIARKIFRIEDDFTPQDFTSRASKIAAKEIIKLLKKINALKNTSRLDLIKKANIGGAYYHKWNWSILKLIIDWSKKIDYIYNFIKACNQESYIYKSPVFKIGKAKYFIRGALIVKKQKNDRLYIGKSKAIIAKIDDLGIHIIKRDEDKILIITKIQKYDKSYFFNRAFHPNKLNTNKLVFN